jgi:hypothetical protein
MERSFGDSGERPAGLAFFLRHKGNVCHWGGVPLCGKPATTDVDFIVRPEWLHAKCNV